jgi:hypothetical protein
VVRLEIFPLRTHENISQTNFEKPLCEFTQFSLLSYQCIYSFHWVFTGFFLDFLLFFTVALWKDICVFISHALITRTGWGLNITSQREPISLHIHELLAGSALPIGLIRYNITCINLREKERTKPYVPTLYFWARCISPSQHVG